MVPPVGVMEKPSAARQKVQVALLWAAGIGVDIAGDVNGVGRGAQAQDLGIEAHRHIDV
jgi:hypothetical protein